MSDNPSLENIALEAAILKRAHELLTRLLRAHSMLPAEQLENELRPALRLSYLDARIMEAQISEKREEENGTVRDLPDEPHANSHARVRRLQLQLARNKVAFEVSKIDAYQGKR